MKQVHLGLCLCLLLAINVTGQYNAPNPLGDQFAGSEEGAEQVDFIDYGVFPGVNYFGNYAQQSNSEFPSLGHSSDVPNADSLRQFSQQLSSSGSFWLPRNDHSTATKQRIYNRTALLPRWNLQGVQRDQTFDTNGNAARDSKSNKLTVVRPYTEPTGPAFGIRSRGDILTYLNEKPDLSKCGPSPTVNPCTIYGPQYYALPGYPNCYIQCTYGHMHVKPCPADLIWNTLINACDWSAVAPEMEIEEKSALKYNENRNKGYSYTRKKRNADASGIQTLYSGFYGPSAPLKNGPLRIPLTPYSLPGPVGFSGHVGFAGIPPQYAGSQSLIASLPQPVTPLKPISSVPGAPPALQNFPFTPTVPLPLSMPGSPVSPSSSFTQTQQTSDSFGQARSNAPTGTLYADANDPSSKVAQEGAPTTFPAAQASAPTTPMANTQPGVVNNNPPLLNFFYPQMNAAMGNPYAAMGNPYATMGNPYAALASPFASNTPVSFEATLIPGPFYPYGPPHGGPFGGPMPSRSEKRKPSLIDILKKMGITGGQQTSSFHFPSNRGFSPAMPFDNIQTQLLARYFGGKSSPMGYSLGGQQYQGFSPFSALPQSPFQMLGYPYGGASSIFQKPSRSPYGPHFKLFVPDQNNDSNEEEEESEDDDDISISSDEIKPAKSKSNNDKNTAKKQTRHKRQYNPYDVSPSVNQPQPYQSNNNPSQYLSQDSMPSQVLYSSLSRASPCLYTQPGTYIAHPTDDTKYIACLSKSYAIFMSCPSTLVYNTVTNRCEKSKNSVAVCEREKPCLNGGQCYEIGSTYKCTCAEGWTGERCENPLSSCANNPCGPGNQCLTLRVRDYEQDYVCVCDDNKSYGLSCGRDTVPNPCSAETNTLVPYYPYAFSRQAFIQCNGNLLYPQPCIPGLVWNDRLKSCDQIEALSDEALLQAYGIVYDQNEKHQGIGHSGAIAPDQNFFLTNLNQQKESTKSQEQVNTNSQSPSSDKTVTIEPPTVNDRLRHRSWRPKNNNFRMAQEQAILLGQKSPSTPATPTETTEMPFVKPVYEDVFYERPQIPIMMRQPSVRTQYHPFQP